VFSRGSSIINQEFYAKDQPAKDKGTITLTLAGLKRGTYTLKATKVGYRANDLQSAWRDLGSPGQLTQAQVATLREKTAGQPELAGKVKIGRDGAFTRTLPLRENDVWFVELTPE
jgi:xylan 1,4-beta-xylosidase